MTAVTEGSGPGIWRGLTARQQPDWPDQASLDAVTSELAALPPLVIPSECELLTRRLAAVAQLWARRGQFVSRAVRAQARRCGDQGRRTPVGR